MKEIRAEEVRKALIDGVPEDIKSIIMDAIAKARDSKCSKLTARIYDPDNITTAPLRQWLYDLGYKTTSQIHQKLKGEYTMQGEYEYTEVEIRWYTYDSDKRECSVLC